MSWFGWVEESKDDSHTAKAAEDMGVS